MATAFSDITLLIVLAAAFGILARRFRQPTILAYLLTGSVVASFPVIAFDRYQELVETLGAFGITLLLFLVGLEMRLPQLRAVGREALLVGAGQITVTTILGFLLSVLLGFTPLESIYLAAALTLSSTVIVVKLLSEKRDLQTLYGRMVIGILLLQDLVAILLLIGLSGAAQQDSQWPTFLGVFLKGAGLVLLILWFGRRIVPWAAERLAQTPELLFIVSIAWALGIAALVASPLIGFSREIGGFLAGLSLAGTAQQFQIDAKIRPLRDFFIVLFFIVLGATITFDGFADITLPAVILSLFVLVGNPLIVLAIMGIIGFRYRTGLLTGLAIAQVSEFSLLLVATGRSLGHLDDRIVSLVTLVAVTTILLSTYLMSGGETVARTLRPLLGRLERRSEREPHQTLRSRTRHIVLIGAHRLGQRVLPAIPKRDLIIVEFDPAIARRLSGNGYTVLFGDASDPEIQEGAMLDRASLIISTMPDLHDTLAILARVQPRGRHGRTVRTIVSAEEDWQAQLLYDAGADYVLLPRFFSGQHLAHILTHGNVSERDLRLWRNLDLKELKRPSGA